jgi:hypothetical protein
VGYVADGKQCPARSTDVPYKKQIFLGSSTLVRLMQGQDIQKGTEGMPLKVRRAQRENEGCCTRSEDPRENSRDAKQGQKIPERTQGMLRKVRRSQRELEGCCARSGDPRENSRDAVARSGDSRENSRNAAQGQEIPERTQGMPRKVRRSQI